jgi:hypothetical protein
MATGHEFDINVTYRNKANVIVDNFPSWNNSKYFEYKSTVMRRDIADLNGGDYNI